MKQNKIKNRKTCFIFWSKNADTPKNVVCSEVKLNKTQQKIIKNKNLLKFSKKWNIFASQNAYSERTQSGADGVRADVVGEGVPLGAARQHHLPLSQLAVQSGKRSLPWKSRNSRINTCCMADNDFGKYVYKFRT